jgi:hypothetical protein
MIYRFGLLVILFVAGGIGSLVDTPSDASAASDVTARVERLGNPFNKGAYARNVWDMQLFGGRIYLGHGNSSNSGVDSNAGPIPVIYYAPTTGNFVTQATVDEEQIDIYRVLDGTLYFPGHDPRGMPPNGNFYRLDGDTWSKVSTIPGAAHVYDMASFGGELFAATGSTTRHTIAASSDGGRTWRSVLPTNTRVYSLVMLAGQLYAIQAVVGRDEPLWTFIHVYDGTLFARLTISGTSIAPGAPADQTSRFVRAQQFGQQLIYIVAVTVNDHQWLPVGLYAAPALDRGRRITLPDPAALPYDIIQRGQTIYVLGASKQPSGQYVNYVYRSTDLARWDEQFRFTAATFARSFEELNGDFYFGLGSDTSSVSSATGDILRVRAVQLTAPSITPSSTATRTPTVVKTPLPSSTPTRTVLPSATREAGEYEFVAISHLPFVGK